MMTTRNSGAAVEPHDPPTAADAGGPIERGGTMGGYRILRRAPDRHGGRCHHGLRDDGDRVRSSVTIVSFEAAVEDGRAMRLIERLDTLEGECIPRVIDVCRSADGVLLVVLEFCGDALSTLLAAGGPLAGGEVVTIAAPILAAITGIHDRGFVHGALSPSSIAIGAGGKPLLLGLERSEELSSLGDRRERDRRAGDDLRAFSDLVSDLSETVVDVAVRERIRRAAEAIRAGAASPFSPSTRSAAEVRLFEIADPVPLALAPPTEASIDDRPERAVRSLASVSGRRPRRRGRRRAPEIVRETAVRLLERSPRLRERLAGVATPAVRWVHSGGRGRRVVLAGTTAAAVAVVVALLLPTGGPRAAQPGGDQQPAPRMATPASEKPVPERSMPARRASSDPSDGPVSDSGAAGSRPAGSPDDDDDAVAATRAVLDVIAACAVRPEGECWERAIEPGSELLEAVTARGADELPASLRLPVEAVDVVEREDFGDARLVTLTPVDATKPASVLMVRTEAGWRIREVFET